MPVMNFHLDDLKHAIFAVCIGLAIQFIGEAAQATIHWLQSIDLNTASGTATTATYMLLKIRHLV